MLNDRLSALRTAYPGWQPLARMLELLRHAQAERDLAGFKAADDWASVRRLAAAYPELADCIRRDDAAVVAVAPGVPSTLDAVLASCPDNAARIALLSAAFDRFGLAAGLVSSLDRLDVAALPPAARDRASQLHTAMALQALGQDLASNALDVLGRGGALRDMLATRRRLGCRPGSAGQR